MPLLPRPATGSPATQEVLRRYHSRHKGPGQCGSVNVQYVAAPLPTVWSLVRRFDRPQDYKKFVKDCELSAGDGGVGSVREVTVVSGLPAGTSTERLDTLGGDHRLSNYQSTTTLHVSGGGTGTVVVESYVVDVPPGNTAEDTCVFADTIIRCNLRSLASISEEMAGSPSDG
ncbi:abscisic acid receptor [Musa troglodytarum]|uniref:Abscisic acid receptor n=1 Tax=Musa troglodytarum TaxID=320322 RepID=A0A9E7FKZ0_9LILI|nr:abscisic acid receptor [Musa troglodytarum]